MTFGVHLFFYLLTVFYTLLIIILGYGFFTFFKRKIEEKIVNKWLAIGTALPALIGFPISCTLTIMLLRRGNAEINDYINKHSFLFPLLIASIILFLVFFALVYIFAYDFGMAIDHKKHKLFLFIDKLDITKITRIEEKKWGVTIFYLRGYKKIEDKITVFLPLSKQFVLAKFPSIIVENKTIQEQAENQDVIKIKNTASDEKIAKTNVEIVEVEKPAPASNQNS